MSKMGLCVLPVKSQGLNYVNMLGLMTSVALICSTEPTRTINNPLFSFFPHPPTPSFLSLSAFCTVAVHFAALHIAYQPLLCSCLQSISSRHPATLSRSAGGRRDVPLHNDATPRAQGLKNCCQCTFVCGCVCVCD